MEKLNIGNVCISSVYSREASFKDYRYVACKAAEDLGYDVYRNPENIGATQREFEKLLENKRPIFVLLVGQVNSKVVKDECNMALSLGLPIITLLWTENGKITTATKRLMNTISKATFEKDCSCFGNCEELYKAIQKRLTAYEAERMITTAKFIPQHAQIYTTSEKIINSAKKRIILCQQTSSVMLGSRSGVKHEQEFYEKLINWIKNASKEMEFLHIFSYCETKSELHNTAYNCSKAKDELLKICSNKNNNISLVIRSTNYSIMPCVICDNNLIVPFKLGMQEYNMFLPHYIIDGSSISRIVADIQGIKGKLLFSSDSATLMGIEDFYK
ncbi:MAG: hypothetical protein J1F28_08575 [Oscillospiraceae bacterium]|nr:hypothetical protein [Oscillospiraceae bacterium]